MTFNSSKFGCHRDLVADVRNNGIKPRKKRADAGISRTISSNVGKKIKRSLLGKEGIGLKHVVNKLSNAASMTGKAFSRSSIQRFVQAQPWGRYLKPEV